MHTCPLPPQAMACGARACPSWEVVHGLQSASLLAGLPMMHLFGRSAHGGSCPTLAWTKLYKSTWTQSVHGAWVRPGGALPGGVSLGWTPVLGVTGGWVARTRGGPPSGFMSLESNPLQYTARLCSCLCGLGLVQGLSIFDGYVNVCHPWPFRPRRSSTWAMPTMMR